MSFTLGGELSKHLAWKLENLILIPRLCKNPGVLLQASNSRFAEVEMGRYLGGTHCPFTADCLEFQHKKKHFLSKGGQCP